MWLMSASLQQFDSFCESGEQFGGLHGVYVQQFIRSGQLFTRL